MESPNYMENPRQSKFNRRNFLKTAGAAGLTAALISNKGLAEPNEPNAPNAAPSAIRPTPDAMPKRKMGKADFDFPVLSLGVVFDPDNQIIYRAAHKWGVRCWDTANIYGNGNSERGIGKFFAANPDARKDIIIITKSSIFGKEGPGSFAVVTGEEMEKRLQLSLKRMNTNYIDLYYGVHEMVRLDQLSNEVRDWTVDAKKRGIIKYFGLSTHKNTNELGAVSKMDWVDVVQIPYNFRLMQDTNIKAAVHACHKAGQGVVAMKTLGMGAKTHTQEEEKLFEHFMKKGYGPEQAKIKYLLEDEAVTTACVGMDKMNVLMANIAAVMDKTSLTQADRDALEHYARATCSGYCAGCAKICDAALPDMPYVSEVMRYLMYYNSYGEQARASQLFAQLPAVARDRLLMVDYSLAEACCPQRMPIAKLVAEAVSKLA